MHLPRKVLALRRYLYSTEEFAERIGVSRNTVLKLEKDPLSVKGTTLRAYLHLLGWRLKVAKRFRLVTLADNPSLEDAL